VTAFRTPQPHQCLHEPDLEEESNQETFHPIDRWKSRLSQSEAAALEVLIGGGLEEFGCRLRTAGTKVCPRFSASVHGWPKKLA
jgi:hypothetical protein